MVVRVNRDTLAADLVDDFVGERGDSFLYNRGQIS
jgi:hypothetical protein